jgi:uncharacterized protein YqeY
VWGANGVVTNLQCSGAREWRCWNSIGFDGALLAKKVVQEIVAELYRLDGFDAQFRNMVAQAGKDAGGDLAQRWDRLRQDEHKLAEQKQKVKDAIVAFGPKPVVKEQIEEFESAERKLAAERRRLEADARETKLDLPESPAELRRIVEQEVSELAADSPELGTLLRKLVPELHVYVVRLCDGGHLLPRVKVKLALDGIIPDARRVAGLPELLTSERTIDLFVAPQRERIREHVVALVAQHPGITHQEISERLPEKATATAVGYALALDRLMRKLGLNTPYVTVLEPPSDYPKFRRHKNPKYRFEPVAGYVPPTL